MKSKKITVWASYLDNTEESDVNVALSELFLDFGGEVFEVLPHEDDKLYADEAVEIVKCKYCGKTSAWEGAFGATPWECEECGEIFCDDCCQIDNENDDRILCLDCRLH